jgi:capsular exopolysaccharide synthesis family protein
MLGDGKSTVVANLGIVLAQSGQRVILLDADLRRPSLHKIFALRNRPGLSRLFVQPPLELEAAIQPTDIPGLFVIPAGYLPPNPLELVGSDKMSGVLRQALDQADIVIIDAPPVTAVSDAAVLAKRVDGVLLVVSSGHTLLEAAKDAYGQLSRAGTKIIGVVMNDKKAKRMRYGYY